MIRYTYLTNNFESNAKNKWTEQSEGRFKETKQVANSLRFSALSKDCGSVYVNMRTDIICIQMLNR